MPRLRQTQSSRGSRTPRPPGHSGVRARDQRRVVGARDQEADEDPHARKPDDADDDAGDRDRAPALMAAGGVDLLHARIAQDDRDDRADSEEPDDADEQG